MADHLKIRLSIADRVYPLTIKKEQEEGLRIAARRIDEMIKRYEENYAVRDKQDVLAMCALQFASQVEQASLEKEYDSKEAQERLQACVQTIASVLLPEEDL